MGLIGPDQPQARKLVPEDRQHGLSAVAALSPGSRDHGQDQPEHADENVSFAAFNLCVGVNVAIPPCRWC
jgi:hypothetical protein